MSMQMSICVSKPGNVMELGSSCSSCQDNKTCDNISCESSENLDSKSGEPPKIDCKSCQPHQKLDSTSFEPHYNLDSRSCEPHENLDSKTYEPHQNLDNKPDEPHLHLDSKSCHEDLGNMVCEPHQNPGNNPYEHNHNPPNRNPCELHDDPASNPCELHDPASNPCELHGDPAGNPCQLLDDPASNPCQLNQNSESDLHGDSQNLGCSCKRGRCCECASYPTDAPQGHLLEDQIEKELTQRWEREQAEYREKLITEDMQAIISWLSKNPESSENSETSENSESEDVKEFYIGGTDISFIKGNNIDACSCLTVVRMSDLQVVYQRIEMIQLTQPYVPGYLAFREVQPLVDLYNRLKVAAPQYLPDVIMVDGNGLLHPRGFGLACHLGVVLGVPTLGVAKTLITAQGIHDDQDHKLKKQTLKFAGDFFDLVSDSGQVLGRCLRTCDKAPNPVYISVGHRITLESAMQICLQCSKYRIPEPVRKADIDSREFLRQNKVEPYEFIQRMNEEEEEEEETE